MLALKTLPECRQARWSPHLWWKQQLQLFRLQFRRVLPLSNSRWRPWPSSCWQTAALSSSKLTHPLLQASRDALSCTVYLQMASKACKLHNAEAACCAAQECCAAPARAFACWPAACAACAAGTLGLWPGQLWC